MKIKANCPHCKVLQEYEVDFSAAIFSGYWFPMFLKDFYCPGCDVNFDINFAVIAMPSGYAEEHYAAGIEDGQFVYDMRSGQER